MSNVTPEIVDSVKDLGSAVQVKPTCSVDFLTSELQRYGIKTRKKTGGKGKTIFYQSCHLLEVYDINVESTYGAEPTYFLISFKDLFKMVNKNDEGAVGQDITRIHLIASKLQERGMVDIVAKNDQSKEDRNQFTNLIHISRNAPDSSKFSFQSKFISNRIVPAHGGEYSIVCSGNHCILV